MKNSAKIAIIQVKPVFLNLEDSISKAEELILEAKANNCDIIAFGETWFCGYPAWLDYATNIANWNNSEFKELYKKIFLNSLIVDSKEFNKLKEIALNNNVILVFGANERVENCIFNGSIFNSLFIIDNYGELKVHHRKLTPTFTEKLIYAYGNTAKSIVSTKTDFGNIGSLICWEHWNPMARQLLHNSNETIHFALWPSAHEIHQLASRHYAFEARCWVVAVGSVMQTKDLPDNLEYNANIINNPDSYIMTGGSSLIAPDSSYLLQPVFEKDVIIYTEIPDLSANILEKGTLDISGHYNRWDLLELNIKN
jgi:nitrilase